MSGRSGGRYSRDKGARAEVDVVNYLRRWWPDVRRYLAGDGRQPGDIDGIPGVSIEVKDQQRHDLSGWMRQAETEARGNLPVLIVKARGHSDPGRWYAIVRLEDMAELLATDGSTLRRAVEERS